MLMSTIESETSSSGRESVSLPHLNYEGTSKLHSSVASAKDTFFWSLFRAWQA
ncbi:hypothetical protein I3843_15G139000 [Carya illinoinensis]|nr:hypothetical protein I3843_15G139000 [Carya illinoinensis]